MAYQLLHISYGILVMRVGVKVDVGMDADIDSDDGGGDMLVIMTNTLQ